MAAEPALAIAVSARDWPDRLRQALADHGGARVRLTALNAHDLDEEHHDVLLIDDISSLLTRGLIGREHARDRRVIGVWDPEEPSGRLHLVELGVDAVVSCSEPAETFVAAAQRLAVVSSDPPVPAVRSVRTEPSEMGTLIDVRGVSGGVGTSEVAFALARVLGRSTVVELGPLPSLAQRLRLDLHPNLLTAIEIVDHAGGDVTRAIQPADRETGVLVGTTEPTSAGRGASRRVVEGIRRRSDWTVLDVGAASTAPVSTDHTVFVSIASPVGISRCLDALAHQDLLDTHVVLNRAPRGAFERSEVMGAVLREIRPRSVTVVPEDPAVTGAGWNGQVVGAGGFAKAIEGLARAIRGIA